MSQEIKPGQVVDINQASSKADVLKDARREAKAKNLKKRFSAARNATEPKTKAAERLKKLFKDPQPKPKKS